MRISADALMVIDLQVDYFKDPRLAVQADRIVAFANELAERARSATVPVIEVRTSHAADASTWTLDMLADAQGMAIAGSEGAAPLPGLALGTATLVTKTRDSAFHATDLAEHLGGVRRPAIAGVSTESCILATVVEAYAQNLRPILVTDAIASSDEGLHDRVISQLSNQYRLPTVETEDLWFSGSAALQ